MSGLLYEVNSARTDDLRREGGRQRLAALAEPARDAEPSGRPRRVAVFRQVARAARVARAASPVS